jgi:hypothetical protein
MVHWSCASHACMVSRFLFVFDWQEGRMADGLPCICIVIVAGMEYELITSFSV